MVQNWLTPHPLTAAELLSGGWPRRPALTEDSKLCSLSLHICVISLSHSTLPYPILSYGTPFKEVHCTACEATLCNVGGKDIFFFKPVIFLSFFILMHTPGTAMVSITITVTLFFSLFCSMLFF